MQKRTIANWRMGTSSKANCFESITAAVAPNAAVLAGSGVLADPTTCWRRSSPGSAAFDPFGKNREIARGEPLSGRHAHIAGVPDRANQRAFFRLAWHHRRTFAAAIFQ